MRGVGIEIGGRRRTLRYDLNALAEIERVLGIGIDQIGQISGQARTIRALVWAGLLHEEPSLTEAEVGSWIYGPVLAQAIEAVNLALTEAFGPGNVQRAEASGGTGEQSSS